MQRQYLKTFALTFGIANYKRLASDWLSEKGTSNSKYKQEKLLIMEIQ